MYSLQRHVVHAFKGVLLKKKSIGNFLELDRESAGRGNRKGERCNSDMLIRALPKVYGHALLSNKIK